MRSSRLLLIASLLGAHLTPFAQPSQASAGYFREFGTVIVQIRTVTWTVDICSAEFPGTGKELEHALSAWRTDHARFLSEMEGQFDRIDAYWRTLPPKARGDMTGQKLREQVDTMKPAVRQEYERRGAQALRDLCASYARLLRTPRMDLEKHLSTSVEAVRRGPPPWGRAQ